MKLAFEHAETHSHYRPKPVDPRIFDTRNIAAQINEIKVTDPEKGQNVYDSLVDQLVHNSIEAARTIEREAEPASWTAPQRCVWRSSTLPIEKRIEIISDRSIVLGTKAFASINAGRWIVNCPFPGCRSAQLASVLDRRFFCVECNSSAVGGKWVEVEWPNSPEGVEQWVVHRPAEAQHWLPGETRAMIIEQDKEHI